jgi:hypothetical protein
VKPQKVKVSLAPHEKKPIKIVADGSVSTRGVLGGRLVPVVLLDTSFRPDVDELIRVHQEAVMPGDVETQWIGLEGHDGRVALLLKFIRPIETKVIIEFDIVRQGIIVENILQGKGLYIQSGHEGERFSNKLDFPKILLEVMDTGFRPHWDKLFYTYLTKHFRAKGLGRFDAKQASLASIKEMRELVKFRMPDVDKRS